MMWPCDPTWKKSEIQIVCCPKTLQEEDDEQYLNMFFQNNVKKMAFGLM